MLGGQFDLGQFEPSLDRGKPTIVCLFWALAEYLFINSVFPFSDVKCKILTLFGAKLGKNVVIKQYVRIKFPWRLVVGDNVWIGESVWIDNLGLTTIGSNTCISQGVYLCTGSHDWNSKKFDLVVSQIMIAESCWIAANATIGPGVCIGKNSVIVLGVTVTKDVPEFSIVRGSHSIDTFRGQPIEG